MLRENIGSWTDPFFSRKTSQLAKRIAAMITSISGTMMAALFHGYYFLLLQGQSLVGQKRQAVETCHIYRLAQTLTWTAWTSGVCAV